MYIYNKFNLKKYKNKFNFFFLTLSITLFNLIAEIMRVSSLLFSFRFFPMKTFLLKHCECCVTSIETMKFEFSDGFVLRITTQINSLLLNEVKHMIKRNS